MMWWQGMAAHLRAGEQEARVRGPAALVDALDVAAQRDDELARAPVPEPHRLVGGGGSVLCVRI
jgi:hypothetical protein